MTGAQFCPSPSAFTGERAATESGLAAYAARTSRRLFRVSRFSRGPRHRSRRDRGCRHGSCAVLASLSADARALLGSDIDLQLVQRPSTDDESAFLRQHTGALSRVIEMRAMARLPPDRDDARTMVELKAVDAAIRWSEKSASILPRLCTRRSASCPDELWGTVVEAGLLNKLGLARGEVVKVGEARFEIRATIAKERIGWRAWSASARA